jgi:hypothetical protein
MFSSNNVFFQCSGGKQPRRPASKALVEVNLQAGWRDEWRLEKAKEIYEAVAGLVKVRDTSQGDPCLRTPFASLQAAPAHSPVHTHKQVQSH